MSPGCASGGIAVGAVDSTDSLAVFSGVGKALDIVAPGVSVYSTIPGGGYAAWSGTSMSTPMVSAVAALLLQKNQSYSAEQIRDSLLSTAVDLGYSQREQGNGRLDAIGAYEHVPDGGGDSSENCPKGKAKKGQC